MNEDFKHFLQSINPKKEFDKDDLPEAPDYADEEFWLALPHKSSFHNLSPHNQEFDEKYDVDVFYIHPTGYFGTNWNATIDPDTAWAERSSTHLATKAPLLLNM